MNNYPKITLLTLQDVWGKDELEVLSKYGREANLTDLAIIRGAQTGTTYIDNNKLIIKGSYFSKSKIDGTNQVHIVDVYGRINSVNEHARYVGIRPVLYAPEIIETLEKTNIDMFGCEKITLGEYPQYLLDINTRIDLKYEHDASKIVETHKTYTFDNRLIKSGLSFKPNTYKEYSFKGKKFIRIKTNFYYDIPKKIIGNYREYELNSFRLSDNHKYSFGDEVLLAVEPVVWLVDRKSNLLIAENCLLSGIMFDEVYNNCTSYDDSFIKEYLEKYMLHDIFNTSKEVTKQNTDKITLSLTHQKLKIEDKINSYLESNIPVLLVEENLGDNNEILKRVSSEYIKVKPEDITNPYIVPKWLEELQKKCDKEPNKTHILLFENIGNSNIEALKQINLIAQFRKYNEQEIPKNVRIIVTTRKKECKKTIKPNLITESEDINVLNDTFITISLNRSDWLELMNDYLHPIIKCYLHSTIIDLGRKWIESSKVLYKTGNMNSLVGLLGEKTTKELIEYYKNRIITTSDIINNNTEKLNLELNPNELSATLYNLTNTFDEDLEKVINYISKYGSEVVDDFLTLWVGDDDIKKFKLKFK